jgi:hypothetical protein
MLKNAAIALSLQYSRIPHLFRKKGRLANRAKRRGERRRKSGAGGVVFPDVMAAKRQTQTLETFCLFVAAFTLHTEPHYATPYHLPNSYYSFPTPTPRDASL